MNCYPQSKNYNIILSNLANIGKNLRIQEKKLTYGILEL